MTEPLPWVVLDTVVLVQALFSNRGHSAGCLRNLRARRFVLLLSNATLDEFENVSLRPELLAKYPYVTTEHVARFRSEIRASAVRIPEPPSVFSLPRDPKDEPFINLAIAGNAHFIVTWNERHLTYLMKRDAPEGIEFCTRFPQLKIVSPPTFLLEIEKTRQT